MCISISSITNFVSIHLIEKLAKMLAPSYYVFECISQSKKRSSTKDHERKFPAISQHLLLRWQKSIFRKLHRYLRFSTELTFDVLVKTASISAARSNDLVSRTFASSTILTIAFLYYVHRQFDHFPAQPST